MSATERLTTEQAFHDDQARQRARTFDDHPEALRFHDDAYLDHETWIRPAFGQLGDLSGKHVLDYGCGHGMAAVVLARAGGRVTAFDLSLGYLDEARQRVRANDVSVELIQTDGEWLPFADGTFDRVWGNAVLHHLDLERAGREMRRVLRPSGVAVFCEPWGENPLLSFARRRLPYSGKQRTPDEAPLREGQVEVLRRIFPRVEMHGYQLMSMARRVVRQRRIVAGLDWCDRMLLTAVPALEQFCRYVVLTLGR